MMSSVRRIGRALRVGLAVAALFSAQARAQQPAVVRSPERPLWGESLRLIEEVRIGKLDGADEYLFGRIDGVAVGRQGTIYVADGQVPIIRSYDAQGRFLRNIGRQGQGPGEYANIGGIRTLRDGRLAVWDNRNGRITLYTSAGDFADSYRV